MRRTNHRNLVNVGILSGRIPLISLVQFIAVAEHLNFRHAAKALGISQSSVSARVKALEDNLGVLLFERHARGVRLTDAGRHFMERVTAGVDQLDHAVKTAEQLGMESHFARLRLLDPNRFHDFETFVAEQQKYQPVADAVTLLLDRAPLTKDQQNAIHDLIAEQDIEPLLKATNTDSEDGENARRELISMLMDRHGTSRLLFRNTRNGVKGFPRRELKAIKMPLPAS